MMAESPITVLPIELMIEILVRVDSSNPLQMRCVCKLWKSLVVDPKMWKKHFHRLSTEVADLTSKVKKHIDAFKSHHPEQDAGVEDAAEEKDDAAPDEDKVKQLLMIDVAHLDKLLLNLLSIKEDMKTLLKVDMETQAVEDGLKCYRSFLRIYHKFATAES